MSGSFLVEKIRYFVKRHPFLYKLRYALITELGGCDFTGPRPVDTSYDGQIPQQFLDTIPKKNLLGDGDWNDACKVAFDLSHGHPRGPGLGWRSVETLQRIYSGERAGVCSDYCQVFLGLCRAAGIEAREWGLCARFDAHVVGHALTEVYSKRAGKWMFLDPYFSVYASSPDDSQPLAVTEMIDLVTQGRADQIQLEMIDRDAVSEERRLGYISRFFDPDHAFFLLSNNDVFKQDGFLRWIGVVPLPVLHMSMILTGNYQKFHVYTNSRNQESMAGRLGDLKRWFRRSVVVAAALLLLAIAISLGLSGRLAPPLPLASDMPAPASRYTEMDSKPPGVLVYPAFNALYYSFYLSGLAEQFRITYSTRGFPGFGHHGLAFSTREEPGRRIFLSASDGPGLQAAALDWCHVYGKANLEVDPARNAAARCLAIGPSFPVRLWGLVPATAWGVANFLRCRGRVEPSPREFFANYWRQYRYRLPLAEYTPSVSAPDYVFFASSLWKKEPETNHFRAHFIEACRSLATVQFEGGFVRRPDLPELDALSVDRRYPAAEYHEKVRRSTVVFNTPAVASCHGWKLAEFLALGKAIVSTPLIRALPAPLDHGVHVHYVDGSVDEIRTAVDRIVADLEYRRHLEKNARDYYLRHLSPSRIIARVLEVAGRVSS